MYNSEIIRMSNYKYHIDLIYENGSNKSSEYTTIRLNLTSLNFNFNLCEPDGSDFRIIDNRGDLAVLNMWIAKWDIVNQKAIIFFGLPNIAPYVKVKLKALFGNPGGSSISNPDSVGALLAYKFDSAILDNSKWTDFTSSVLTDYGYRLPNNQENLITSITNPLYGVKNWAIEFSIYANFDDLSITQTSYMSAGLQLTGTENPFIVGLLQTSIVRHNITIPGGGTYENSVITEGGIEGYSCNEVRVEYKEAIDSVEVSLKNRNNYSDTKHIINRKVEGDTTLSNVGIYGRNVNYLGSVGGYPTYIQWIIISEIDGLNMSEIDGTPLYIPYELIPHQNQDFRDYGGNIVAIENLHEASFGGDPYLLTSNVYDTSYISNQNAVYEDEIYITFYTTLSQNIVDKSFTHYDSGHILYLNASKLSEPVIDDIKYYKADTTQSWTAIEFNNKKRVTSFSILNQSNTNEMPKDYIFMGSTYNPYGSMDKADILCSGIFDIGVDWMPVEFSNDNFYNYYILKIVSTYGNLPASIKRWSMNDYYTKRKSYVSQLRLLPSLDGYTSAFPKEISLLASNDNMDWSTLLPWTYTYTPFVSHVNEYGFWQHYSFYNTRGFKYYKLRCRGNWGHSSGCISINSSSLHELSAEDSYVRILSGNSNNIKQVWASNNIALNNSIGKMALANDSLNIVTNSFLKYNVVLPDNYNDIKSS